MTCPNCAGLFAIAESFIEECRRLGNFRQMYACPYCKQERGYGKPPSQVEKEKLQAQIVELERANRCARDTMDAALKEAEHFRQSRDEMKGALSKANRRVKNGVCPCCNRTVKQLAAHMKSKHPNFQNSI